jgi:hypothetical protein
VNQRTRGADEPCVKASSTTLPLDSALQPAIANCRSSLQRRLDIARLNEFPFLLRVMCSYAGKAVSL